MTILIAAQAALPVVT